MVLLTYTTVVALIAAFAEATPLSVGATAQLGPSSLMEKINIPSQWKSSGTPHPNVMMKMQIGLKQKNMGGLQKKLLDISDPKSANYGKWLSKDELEAFTSPSEESVKSVKTWLSSFGIKDSAMNQPTPDWLEVNVPISQAEKMLNSKYEMYTNGATGQSMARTTQYSIPKALHDHVDTIQPTTSFHRHMGAQVDKNFKSDSGKTKRQSGCNSQHITPSCIRSYYNVDYTAKGKASLAVTGFIEYSASHNDAAQYLSQYQPAAKGTNFKDVSIAGFTNNPNDATLEGNLDTQIALSVGYPNPVSYLAVGPVTGNPNTEPFGDELVNFGNYLNSASSPPTSVSTSYGQEEQGLTSNYLDRICNEFMKAGSRGVSIFFSSGDFGVGGNGEQNCNQGFYALFPASCPYITSVGSTQFSNGGEIAATFDRGGSTGGGYSWYFNAPTWQSNDTSSYARNNLDSSYDGYYNANGRGYPDVALIGEYYDIVINGGVESGVYGTSASSPAWASLVSLINDQRISQGKSTLGFLNPLLYSKGRSAFKDITAGNNRGCGTYGFPAAQGWDPTTGLGTPNFSKLRQALQ
ncbi:family S53 protease-like protein [Pochonia chlamydosporia 170]|uniref:Family S53 protease-like protein n=1 Tax=Pochonia chlamydosporia 170 TaxID=1380566 RepID=A0A179FJK6_METCM|nr:family S53 protease-like protein [Pochonia chlamydosporia 170]OAQ65203.1 family S53 protease-like protein [Pochonia chlamydosporia 170]